MSIKKYQAKRKFNKTTEPRGKISQKNLSRFVIQEHHARNLHYDFRLEMPASKDSKEIVLKSWAVPKGVPEKKGIKRLAVQVEDHPIDYINFSGTIPEGEYGAGRVKIWDKGKYKIITGTLKDGSIKFSLHGKKVTGEYVLVRLKKSPHFKDGVGINNWLIFKT